MGRQSAAAPAPGALPPGAACAAAGTELLNIIQHFVPVVNTFLLYQRKTASLRSRRKAKIGTKILRLCQKLYPWLRSKQARSTKCWPIKFSAIFWQNRRKRENRPPKGSVPVMYLSPAGAGPAAAPPLPPQEPAPSEQGAPDKSGPAQRCRERHGQKRPAGRNRCPTGYPVKEPFCPIFGGSCPLFNP